MASLLQRLQAKIEEYQKNNPNKELSADDEAEIMQKLAEERLPKDTAIVVKDDSSQKEVDGPESAKSTDVSQPADNADKALTNGPKESSAEANEHLQQQEDSASKDSKDNLAEGSADGGQQDGTNETPAHKSMPDDGKDDGEQQRSDIPAAEQDEILADSALRPGLTTSESQIAADKQQDGAGDEPKGAGEEDNDKLQKEPGQQDGSDAVADDAEAEEEGDADSPPEASDTKPEAEGDNDDSIKAGDLNSLKDLEVNSDGMIYDSRGNAVARLAEGQPDELAGWPVGDDGEILDEDGDLIGRVELIKHEGSLDEGEETNVQEPADENKGEVPQTEGGGFDDDRGKAEAAIADPDHEADTQPITDKSSGDSPQVDADAEQTVDKASGDSPEMDADAEQIVNKDLGDSAQANATEEQPFRKGVSGKKPPRKLQDKSKAQGVNSNQEAEKAGGKDPQTQEKGDADEVDSADQPIAKDDEKSEQGTDEVKQDVPDEQISGEAQSSEPAPEKEFSKDSEKQEQPALHQDRQNTEDDSQPAQKSGQPEDAEQSEEPVKTSGDDENTAPEKPERQDSGVQDVSESKEKQDDIIGDSEEVRPDPVEDQEGASGKQDEQGEDDQETDLNEEVNARSDEQDDKAEKDTTKDGDAEGKEAAAATGTAVGGGAAAAAEWQDQDGHSGDKGHEESQAADGSDEKKKVDEGPGAKTAGKEAAKQSGQQNSKARGSDEAHGALDTHNTARQDKGTQPLRWDDELASEAAEFAQKLSKSRKFQHSGVEEHGENIFVSTEDVSYEHAVQSWLAEETNYEGEKFGEGNAAKYARFTQCMWQNSSHVGIAKATSKHGGTFIVARYWPQGNIVGEKPY